MKKSFTLIELLIVVGILAVLVVTILITLNPSEAQKKARDAKRMKDLVTLQAIVQQWINDGNAAFCNGIWCHSYTVAGAPAGVGDQPCSSNWLGVNVCNYAKTVPVDPLNGRNGTVVCGGTVSNPQTCTTIYSNPVTFDYELIMRGSDYKIIAYQESKSDANNVLNDGGVYDWWTEVFSGQVSQSW